MSFQLRSTCSICRIRNPLLKKWQRRFSSPAHRPAGMPKPDLDIKHIARNPGLYAHNCEQRKCVTEKEHSWKILELQTAQRANIAAHGELLTENRDLVRKIAALTTAESASTQKGKEELQVFMSRAKEIRDQVHRAKERQQNIENAMAELALGLPNLSAQPVPEGPNPEVVSFHNLSGKAPPQTYSYVPALSRPAVSHLDIANALGLLDIPTASITAGTGFYYLLGQGALLEQALIQHAIRHCIDSGFTLVSPPTVVNKYTANMAGYAPRDVNGETQIYELAGKETPQVSNSSSESGPKPAPFLTKVLTGTSEIPLAAMLVNKKFDAARDLPRRYAAVSRCYRAEAGGRGRDTKGLYRVHEFTKVELFAWTLPDNFVAAGAGKKLGKEVYFDTCNTAPTTEQQEDSHFWQQPASQMFSEMLALQKRILALLGLPLRVLNMPPPELGASAALKYDIEALFPSRVEQGSAWGELASLSLCTDYQTRRMLTRIGSGASGGGLQFPYSLNGTALAVPRVWAALLEHGWDAERRVVRLPQCLWAYMGCEEIGGK